MFCRALVGRREKEVYRRNVLKPTICSQRLQTAIHAFRTLSVLVFLISVDPGTFLRKTHGRLTRPSDDPRTTSFSWSNRWCLSWTHRSETKVLKKQISRLALELQHLLLRLPPLCLLTQPRLPLLNWLQRGSNKGSSAPKNLFQIEGCNRSWASYDEFRSWIEGR
jgi:hypothetical protein